MTHKHLIDLWPSIAALAADMGKPFSTVRNWRDRDRIPMEYWVAFVNAAQDRDISVTYRQLAEAVADSGRDAA